MSIHKRKHKVSHIDEWSDYYFDYHKFKKNNKHLSLKEFYSVLSIQFGKVNSFYIYILQNTVNSFGSTITKMEGSVKRKEITKLEEKVKKWRNILDKNSPLKECSEKHMMDNDTFWEESDTPSFVETHFPRKFLYRKIKRSLGEFSWATEKLSGFRYYNMSSFLKINKKFLKSENEEERQYAEYFKNSTLLKSFLFKDRIYKEMDKAISRLHYKIFGYKDTENAINTLRSFQRGTNTQFLLGGFLGGVNFIITLSVLPLLTLTKRGPFVAMNNLFLGYYMFGMCFVFFEHYKVNYKHILRLDRSSDMTISKFFVLGGSIHLLYLILCASINLARQNSHLITIQKGGDNNSYAYEICGKFWSNLHFFKISLKSLDDIFDVLYFFFLFILFIIPIRYFYFNSRTYLTSTLGRGVLLPYTKVKFRHFFFVDVAQSFKYTIDHLVIQSLQKNSTQYKFTYLILVGMFPFARVLQCIRRFVDTKDVMPHMANLIKYLSDLLYFTISIFIDKTKCSNLPLFFYHLFHFYVTLFKVIWDLCVDFNIFRIKKVYPKSFYIWVVFITVFGRFFWLVKESFYILNTTKSAPNHNNFLTIENLCIFSSIMEIIRRYTWASVRIEVEHLNNCNKLKKETGFLNTHMEYYYKKDDEINANIDDYSSTQDTETGTGESSNNTQDTNELLEGEFDDEPSTTTTTDTTPGDDEEDGYKFIGEEEDSVMTVEDENTKGFMWEDKNKR